MTERDAWRRARGAIAAGLGITLPVAWYNVTNGRALPSFFVGVSVGALLMALFSCWLVWWIGRPG